MLENQLDDPPAPNAEFPPQRFFNLLDHFLLQDSASYDISVLVEQFAESSKHMQLNFVTCYN